METHCFEDASDLLQHPLHIPDRAQDQGAHHDVHRLVLYLLHVLSRGNYEPFVSQMLICVHAPPQVLLEVRVGVAADHGAAVRVEAEVCPAATADFQQMKCAARGCKFAHVSEKVSLRVVHFIVVGKCVIVGEGWEHVLVHAEQADELH